MADELNTLVRGPDSYNFARRVLEALELRKVWPTPLNFELWMHLLTSPEGELAQEIERFLAGGQPFNDAVAEQLAARFLPRLRLNDEIRDAGDILNRQLDSIGRAIDVARQSSDAYGRTLAGAGRELDTLEEAPQLRRLIDHLSDATRRVQRENGALEKRLAESTAEVRRLREHLEQVRRDAMTDGLTNLANRKAFDEAVSRLCEEDDEAPLCLAVIDIDHFKRFNDTWGHQTGDQVLRYVANVIGRVGGPPRLASRYGGEEFAILFPSETARTAEKALQLVRTEIASRALKRRSTNEDLGAVTVSAGLAQRRPGETAAALIERADAALYTSKRAGRNRVTDADSLEAAA